MSAKRKLLLVVSIAALTYAGYIVYRVVEQDMMSRDISRKVTSQPREKPLSPKTLQTARIHYEPLSVEQRSYLHMVNQYELAKMKHRLLEERAAIAAAEQRIIVLNKETRRIDEVEHKRSISLPYQLSYVGNQDGEWTATLSRSGHYYEVHVGSELVDGIKIIDISHHGVTLQDGMQRKQVTFDGVVEVPTELQDHRPAA